MTSTLIPRLISIPVSHYCEKVRWAMEWLEIPYVEERHVPLIHRFYTRQVGGSSVPVLVTQTATFIDSADILHHLDDMTSSDKRLYPNNPELRRQIDQLEDTFNHQLAPHVRCWGYFNGFQDWGLMQTVWCDGVPGWERALFPFVFPLVRRKARKAYNINFESAIASLDQIQQIFDVIGSRLADGRKYLVGDDFSAADLTFACLAAPTLFPPEYGVPFPQLDSIPSQMADQIQVFRETPAGKYVLRLYRQRQSLLKYSHT